MNQNVVKVLNVPTMESHDLKGAQINGFRAENGWRLRIDGCLFSGQSIPFVNVFDNMKNL